MKAVTKAEAVRYFSRCSDKALFCPECYNELEGGKCINEACVMDDVLGLEEPEITQ